MSSKPAGGSSFRGARPCPPGRGLGLAITKSLVAELDGDSRVESEVGKGTRFVARRPSCAMPPERPGAGGS
jgi:signal transduction histidine kinase